MEVSKVLGVDRGRGRRGPKPVDHEGILTAKASRIMRMYLTTEGRARFRHFVDDLDDELTAAEKRKAG